jgi:predicted acylesterase/phospholipase RssA
MTAQASRQKRPTCDLVMKGGATSGVVYPPVIAELAEKYEFANIGGTSAGAIAAAVTAAAEYGRKSGHLDDFAPLNKLSMDLSKPGMLLTLFRASAPAHLRPLLDTLLPLVSDPGAADGAPIAQGEEPLLPPIVRSIAPEWLDLLTPPRKPDAPKAEDRLGQHIRALFKALPEHHQAAYQKGATAAGLAAERIGRWLILAAVALAAIFLVPVLLSLTVASALAWAICAAVLIIGAFWLSSAIASRAIALGGASVALGNLGWLLLNDVPQNMYGICTGRKQPDTPADQPALTDWLNSQLHLMAGATPHGGPLTFADLHDQRIQLQMVTTNLSHGRPYVLPFDTEFTLLFQRGDVEALFPEEIVRYMCQDRHTYPGWILDDLNQNIAEHDPRRYYMLPNSADLPVIFGMRMSLSFPVLISAVRLYTVSGHCPVIDGMYRPQQQHLQPNWFSDGGICSNFPIHFFDSWLPTHPTFGINLTALPRDAFDTQLVRSADGAKSVATDALQPEYVSQIAPEAPSMPLPKTIKDQQDRFLEEALIGVKMAPPEVAKPNPAARVLLPDAEQPMPSLWRPVESLTRFVWSLFDTAMNYRDTTQLSLPSYKERAVQIRLDGTREGGLNLNMPAETLTKLQQYGAEAGVLLRDRFDFDRHRWVRFRVLMSELEHQILSLEEPLNEIDDKTGRTVYDTIMYAARAAGFPFASIAQPPWLSSADTRMRALRAMIGVWSDANRESSELDGPRPSADLAAVLLELTAIWRNKQLSPEQSAAYRTELLGMIARWESESTAPPRYRGREVRFFRPVTSTGIELRVTPEL